MASHCSPRAPVAAPTRVKPKPPRAAPKPPQQASKAQAQPESKTGESQGVCKIESYLSVYNPWPKEHWTVWVTTDPAKPPAPKFAFCSGEGCWTLLNTLEPMVVDLAENTVSWFFMRGDISPRWEDPKNVNGSRYCMLVDRAMARGEPTFTATVELLMYLLASSPAETPCNDSMAKSEVTGIEMVPYRGFVRVWQERCVDHPIAMSLQARLRLHSGRLQKNKQ